MLRIILGVVLGLVAALAGYCNGETVHNGRPLWVEHIDHECRFDPGRLIRGEGVAALDSHELVVYCVTRNSSSNPGLLKRGEGLGSNLFQVNLLFLDITDGHVVQRASWPTLIEAQADVFPVNDQFFLLVAGNAVQLIDRTTLSTSRRIVFATVEKGCQPWKVAASIDGTSFGVSRICHTTRGLYSNITAYRSKDFATIVSWHNEGVNFYEVFDSQLSRWSTDDGGYSNEIILHTPDSGDTALRGAGFIVSKSVFVNREELFCCRQSSWLRLIKTNGHEVAYLNLDPKHSPSDPKIIADQIFASSTGQRIGALLFHVPWTGRRSWKCDVFNREFKKQLEIDVPSFRYDLTAVFSHDDKYLYVLRDADVVAYSIP
jgi:hypothetical protein